MPRKLVEGSRQPCSGGRAARLQAVLARRVAWQKQTGAGTDCLNRCLEQGSRQRGAGARGTALQLERQGAKAPSRLHKLQGRQYRW